MPPSVTRVGMASEQSAGLPAAAPRPPWRVVLRALREAVGLPQQAWADLLGVGRGTVRRWESGEAAPNAVAEQALLAYCRDRGLFRAFSSGPLAGLTLTPELLSDWLAEARLGTGVERPRSSGAAASSAAGHNAEVASGVPTGAAAA